jgi:hypothetical protein
VNGRHGIYGLRAYAQNGVGMKATMAQAMESGGVNIERLECRCSGRSMQSALRNGLGNLSAYLYQMLNRDGEFIGSLEYGQEKKVGPEFKRRSE